MSSRKTRGSDSHKPYLGEAVGSDHLSINGCRLPTKKQVLLCYISNIHKVQLDNKGKFFQAKPAAIKNVIRQISLHYNKAGIPIKSERAIKYEVQKLHASYYRLKKNSKNVSKKLDLDSTMILWPKNLKNEISKA